MRDRGRIERERERVALLAQGSRLLPMKHGPARRASTAMALRIAAGLVALAGLADARLLHVRGAGNSSASGAAGHVVNATANASLPFTPRAQPAVGKGKTACASIAVSFKAVRRDVCELVAPRRQQHAPAPARRDGRALARRALVLCAPFRRRRGPRRRRAQQRGMRAPTRCVGSSACAGRAGCT